MYALFQFGDVNEAVLVNSDVDERAESGDVRDHSLEQHALPQVAKLADSFGKPRHAKLPARVAAGLLQFVENILKRWQSGAVIDELPRVERLEQTGVANKTLRPRTDGLGHFLDQVVAFRMDRRIVQGLLPTADTEEARALLERFASQPRHVAEGVPAQEAPWALR